MEGRSCRLLRRKAQRQQEECRRAFCTCTCRRVFHRSLFVCEKSCDLTRGHKESLSLTPVALLAATLQRASLAEPVANTGALLDGLDGFVAYFVECHG